MWIDCEMTGLDLGNDLLVEVAALVTDSELNVLGTGVDGALRVPLGRRSEGDRATVTVTLPGSATTYEGEIALVRSFPNGPDCPPVCVNGAAELDLARGQVVEVAGT